MSTRAVGELVHLDIKKLGRFWQVGKRILQDGVRPKRTALAGSTPTSPSTTTHATRIVELHRREQAPRLRRLRPGRDPRLRRAAARQSSGSSPTTALATAPTPSDDLLAEHGIRHIRTRPYTPRTNGKAEAFIRILQREWAYAFIYPSSSHRARALPGWLRWYNKHRPHGGIGGHPPISRVSHAARSYS